MLAASEAGIVCHKLPAEHVGSEHFKDPGGALAGDKSLDGFYSKALPIRSADAAVAVFAEAVLGEVCGQQS
jgi:hypothetical protein